MEDQSTFLPEYFSSDPGAMRLSVLARTRQSYQRVWKRVFDIVLALLMLPALLPVIAVLWLLARSDGGPGFFGHRRIGQRGRTFRCYKIRTMVPDAERRLAEHLAANPEAAKEWARDHKLTDDPRITRFGGFLRASSLDELPQIWNVLRGDMSFVGPRPVVRAEMRRYGPYRTAYLAMKPGITGIWQVSGRNDVSYEERVRMDVSYLAKVSLKTDLYVLSKTANAVFDRTGR